jgi:phosphate transport system ATP-binding protein
MEVPFVASLTAPATARAVAAVTRQAPAIKVEGLCASYGSFEVLSNISLEIPANKITALIGPSGCGKSTFVRCLNRLHELVRHASVGGRVLLDQTDLYEPSTDAMVLRREIGMVFQQPNPFPTMSIFDNVAAGPKLLGVHDKRLLQAQVEEALRRAAIWDEVKDDLRKPALDLSGGQQQRLCIARAIAVRPSVLLLDEPCSALDPGATSKIEDLMVELRRELTIVLVTHNLQQAARVSDNTAFFLSNELQKGELIEYGPTPMIFTNPLDQRTEHYVTGCFG